MSDLKNHISKKESMVLNGSVIFYTLFASMLLCGMSFVQKIIAGYNPFIFKGYYIPLIFGCIFGFLIGLYFRKFKLAEIVLKETITTQNMLMENLPAGIIIKVREWGFL